MINSPSDYIPIYRWNPPPIARFSSNVLLSDEEMKVLDDYDEIFEKYSMFCNGRWLGVQVLQDSQDMMYIQHIVYMN